VKSGATRTQILIAAAVGVFLTLVVFIVAFLIGQSTANRKVNAISPPAFATLTPLATASAIANAIVSVTSIAVIPTSTSDAVVGEQVPLTSTSLVQPSSPSTRIPTPTTVRILSEQDAVAQVLPSVVRIQAGDSVGSGIVVDGMGVDRGGQVVITNAHVVGLAQQAYVQFQTGLQIEARVERVDRTLDLALLPLPDNSHAPATLASVEDLQLGEPLLAIGYALDLQGGPSVTRGVFSAHRTGMNETDYVQTDAPINPGNSGGPLISLKAEVVGVNTFRIAGNGGSPVQGLGFAISSASIRHFLSNTSAPSAAPTATAVYGREGPADSVQAFYRFVNQRMFPQAWALLSSNFHDTIPYDKWVAGYSTTRFVYVTDIRLASQNGSRAIVSVTVVAVDLQKGQYVTRTFGGQWQLVYLSGSWQLDVGNIGVVQ